MLDKILPIWKAKGDVTDAEKGRDLIIELTKAKTPQGKEYTVIQTIMYDDPQPLHEDKGIMEGWVQDELTWNDVYSKKAVEYLFQERLINLNVDHWMPIFGHKSSDIDNITDNVNYCLITNHCYQTTQYTLIY